MGRRIPEQPESIESILARVPKPFLEPDPGYISFHVSNDRALAVFKDVVLRRRDVAMGDT